MTRKCPAQRLISRDGGAELHRRIVMNFCHLKIWACAAALIAAGALSAQAQGNTFNTPGNILISDQYNNRLIEVNPDTHGIVWTFGNGSSVAGPQSVVGVNDAQRIGSLTLVAGTGVPEPNPPAPTDAPIIASCLSIPAAPSSGSTAMPASPVRVPTSSTHLYRTHGCLTTTS